MRLPIAPGPIGPLISGARVHIGLGQTAIVETHGTLGTEKAILVQKIIFTLFPHKYVLPW